MKDDYFPEKWLWFAKQLASLIAKRNRHDRDGSSRAAVMMLFSLALHAEASGVPDERMYECLRVAIERINETCAARASHPESDTDEGGE